MSQSTSINVKLVDSLAQIILSLTDEERQLLAQKVQSSSLSAQGVQLRTIWEMTTKNSNPRLISAFIK